MQQRQICKYVNFFPLGQKKKKKIEELGITRYIEKLYMKDKKEHIM